MSIEIKSQPRRPDLTSLPSELVDYFASRDCQVGLRKHSPDVLGMDYAIGWRPVEIDSMPEEIQRLLRASFEVRVSGHCHRGDCVLAMRSCEAQRQQQELIEEQRQAQQDDARWLQDIEETMQQMARSTGRSTGAPLLVGNVPLLRDQVVGGERLAPLVEQELRGRGRRTTRA